MEIWFWLAPAMGNVMATVVEKRGFGLQFDIFESNIINLSIVIGILIWFGRDFLGKILGDRQSQLEVAIRDAETQKREASSALAAEQQKLAQAQTEAKQILATAERNGEAAKVAILAQADKDVERLKAAAAQDLTSQQERMMMELRQRIAALALERAEAQLSNRLTDETQQRLIDQSIAQLGG